MCLQVKKSGMMIGGRVLEETDTYWIFKANDEKGKKKILKSDDKNTVCCGEDALDAAYEWLSQFRKIAK